MKIKVIMNSGKEYIVDEEIYTVDDFTSSFFNQLPVGNVMQNKFVYLDREENIVINPTHISSIEVIQK